MPNKLTDSEIVKALKQCEMQQTCSYCPYFEKLGCKKRLYKDALDLINRLQAENERLKAKCENTQIGYNFAEDEIKRLKNDLAISKKETKRYQGSYITAKKESTKNHKELLKSKVFKYVRNPNRIYTIMDFQDGEILRFYDYPERPNALASGYYKFQGKNDIRLLHISEVKELSYEEIKTEAYKEFAEKLKKDFNDKSSVYDKFVSHKVDNLLKELVGEDNG